MTRMQRQLLIFNRIKDVPTREQASFGRIVGPGELTKSFGISLRTLQRDLRDIRECGLINVVYDKSGDRYLESDKTAIPGEGAGARRMQHLSRLYRLGTLIDHLPSVSVSELEDYESRLSEYNDLVEWSKESPEDFTPEDVKKKYDEVLAHKPEFCDIAKTYSTLFPACSARTRQRDLRELRSAGFDIYYDSRHKAVIYLVNDE